MMYLYDLRLALMQMYPDRVICLTSKDWYYGHDRAGRTVYSACIFDAQADKIVIHEEHESVDKLWEIIKQKKQEIYEILT